ncbi:MAG: PglZ domain-containing protein [Bacteroidales bacterium]|nr:PglZ domain-containing protein [Bacteroidales bacterium]
MENQIKILWVDDEIDLLKPHIMFLEQKSYTVFTSNNGDEALDILKDSPFDIVFLDENMPGLSGIETLSLIKNSYPNLPVVMITKSEEETIMEDAIGSNISDYLIKPVNPKQILLCLKKNLENKKIRSEKTTSAYQQEFRNLGMEISAGLDHHQWKDIYKKLINWELKLERSEDEGMKEVFSMQKQEANQQFCRFVERNYEDWVAATDDDRPILSHRLMKEKVVDKLTPGKPLFFILVDNLRFDQWKMLQPLIEEYFRILEEDMYYSILPTVTQYARNAMFAGLMPIEIQKKYPQYWVNEDMDETKNKYESQLLGEQLKRFGKNIPYSYNKVLSLTVGRKLVDNMPNLMNNDLNVIVYNFIDMLSHARTEMEVIRELADDDAAYRSLTLSWFEHSPLFEILKFISEKKADIIITTDHGSVRVDNPVKVVGDRNTNNNLRYKIGKSLNYNKKEVYEVKRPENIHLPRLNVSSTFIFCRDKDFFAYPNNFNYYVNYYKNTFQHGGISMEEVLIPFIHLKGK